MTLFKLSLKNLKKSVRDYAIYFLTLVLGVAIFYVFNAIEDQTVMLEITATARELINLMLGVLSGVSVFVAFILGFLIIYASRFLMKRRGREFAIYMTLGMGKGADFTASSDGDTDDRYRIPRGRSGAGRGPLTDYERAGGQYVPGGYDGIRICLFPGSLA